MLILFSIAVLILAALLYFVPIFGRYIGGFFGAFAAAEATLCALDDRKNCFWGALEGLLLILAAGLCIAAFYGVPEYMLRLRGFSGVKLTLLLPPLLVLLHDLKRRVYPEELKEVLSRPPLWGELIVLGVLMGAVLFMAVRSDNTALVPAWEIALRENLERLLRVRPRTKEFLVGYPSLLLWYVAKKRDLIPRYREIFRLCASIGFASAINTFCHLHTQFFLTVIRTINGWWAGMLIGTVLAVAVNLIWQSRHKQDRQSAITQPSM